jgi:gamma-glutamyltranspeptidase/glutathione hydrolase
VPGTVAGLALAHERYGSGKFTLAQLIAPAIELARDGFVGRRRARRHAAARAAAAGALAAAAKIFLAPDGDALGRGDRLVQTDLAATLDGDRRARSARVLRRSGRREDRRQSVRSERRHHDADDLKSIGRSAPVRCAAPIAATTSSRCRRRPPAACMLIEMLNILEGFPLRDTGAGSAATLHLMIEAMKRAYADRARYLGDPAFVNAPVAD